VVGAPRPLGALDAELKAGPLHTIQPVLAQGEEACARRAREAHPWFTPKGEILCLSVVVADDDTGRSPASPRPVTKDRRNGA
jgi:hypothetical protein